MWCVGSSAVHWKDCTFLLCVEWRDVNVDVFVSVGSKRSEKKEGESREKKKNPDFYPLTITIESQHNVENSKGRQGQEIREEG